MAIGMGAFAMDGLGRSGLRLRPLWRLEGARMRSPRGARSAVATGSLGRTGLRLRMRVLSCLRGERTRLRSPREAGLAVGIKSLELNGLLLRGLRGLRVNL